MSSLPSLTLRITALLVALTAASVGFAQTRPPVLEPIPEPPPSIGFDQDSASERGIRLSPRAGEVIEETIKDGKHVVRIQAPSGAEYMLIEDLGDGTYAGQSSHDSRIRIPLWVIHRF